MSKHQPALIAATFTPYCGTPGCPTRIIRPLRAAVIAALISAVIFVAKWISLERSVESMDRMSKRLHLNSPTPSLIELNQNYPILWIGLAVAVAALSALVHGRFVRHSTHWSLVMGAFGVPGGTIVALWVGAALLFKVW